MKLTLLETLGSSGHIFSIEDANKILPLVRRIFLDPGNYDAEEPEGYVKELNRLGVDFVDIGDGWDEKIGISFPTIVHGRIGHFLWDPREDYVSPESFKPQPGAYSPMDYHWDESQRNSDNGQV